MFCNITFIGYPILQELYGNIGLLCAIVFSMIYNVVFYSWGMFYLGDRGRGSLRSILTNKIALASVLALVMYLKTVFDPKCFYLVAVRQLLLPAVCLVALRLLGVDPEIIRISTVIAALPSGTMTSIVAADYGCAPDYAANIMVQTMLAMLAALPAWVFLVGM